MTAPIVFPVPRCDSLSSEELSIYRHHMKRVWKDFVRDNRPTAAQMMLRNIVLGYDPLRGFSPITSPNKLLNGMEHYSAALAALWLIKNADLSTWRVFVPEVDPDAKLLPSVRLWKDQAAMWSEHLAEIMDHVRRRNKEARHEASI